MRPSRPVPLIFSLDVIHGYQTIFPVPLMEASSWDMQAISRDESVSAAEATADGIKWTFNPMVDIARDPRWSLAAHQTRSVTFTLDSSNLGYYDSTGHFVVHPGAFDVFVGDSSVGGLQSQFTLG